MSAPAYVGIAAVLERYDGEWSRWQIRELCRTHRFPHRKMPATKRLLFSLATSRRGRTVRRSSWCGCRTAVASSGRLGGGHEPHTSARPCGMEPDRRLA
jgi:hypothetical protein